MLTFCRLGCAISCGVWYAPRWLLNGNLSLCLSLLLSHLFRPLTLIRGVLGQLERESAEYTPPSCQTYRYPWTFCHTHGFWPLDSVSGSTIRTLFSDIVSEATNCPVTVFATTVARWRSHHALCASGGHSGTVDPCRRFDRYLVSYCLGFCFKVYRGLDAQLSASNRPHPALELVAHIV